MYELGELHIRELLERAGETGLMRDQFSRTVPAADTPQDGVVLQALDQVASGGEIVNGFSYSYESAGDGEAILSRTAIPSLRGRHETVQRQHGESRYQMPGRFANFPDFQFDRGE